MTYALVSPLVLLMPSVSDSVACATGSVPSFELPSKAWRAGHGPQLPTAADATRRHGRGTEVRPRRTAIV
jgi:hypothetical protein